MAISFNRAYYTKIQDMISIIRSEGQYVFSCKDQTDNECWITFCGMHMCFVNNNATRLKARDLDILISIPNISNDNENICPAILMNFLSGDSDTLAHWHKQIVAFRVPEHGNVS